MMAISKIKIKISGFWKRGRWNLSNCDKTTKKKFSNGRYQIKSYNPGTGRVRGEYSPMEYWEIEGCISEMDDSFQVFKGMDPIERFGMMSQIVNKVEKFKDDCAKIISLEMGKPYQQSQAEVEKCISLMNFYVHDKEHGILANDTQGILPDVVAPFGLDYAKIVYEPIGIIFQIAPFNYPFWQVIRFAFPAMVTGNTVMIRHSHCPENGELLEELFYPNDYFPRALLNIHASREDTSKIIADPRVKGVAFTGSSEVGSIIAGQAGTHLKKHVLELGGSDAMIVCEDADLDLAVEKAFASRVLGNAGQSCNSTKRLIVHESIKEEFEEKVLELFEQTTISHPFGKTDKPFIGPLARKDLRDGLHEQVLQGIEDGARLLHGGDYPKDKKGFFYNPTLLTDVSPKQPSLFFEETFGPVMCIIPFAEDEEAVSLSNMSSYGLSGAVMTTDLSRGDKIARELDVGMSFVNDYPASDWRLPFGGFPGKKTGYGRECGVEGVMEWVNVKTIITK